MRMTDDTQPGSAGYEIRPIRNEEKPLLEDFLYEALFVPEGAEPFPRSILQDPHLKIYTEAFGEQAGDYCLVAQKNGRIVGAAWCRIMDDYGHVDDETPSLALSLYKEYRGQGIGTELLRRLLQLLRSEGYQRISLSVQKANYAVRMYQRAGFQVLIDKDEEYIMVCDLAETAVSG